MSVLAQATPKSPPYALSNGGTDNIGRISRIDQLQQQIDLADINSILFFGASAQESLTGLAEDMLGDLKNKETGEAGNALNDMVATLRGFDAAQLERDTKPSWIGRLMGSGRDLAKALQRYESVRDQIDAISIRLEQQQTALMLDVESLERLYEAGTDSLKSIDDYIAAGEQRVGRLDSDDLPQLRRLTQADHNTLASQRLRDMQTARDQLDRRIHDLKLSRQVLLQNLPAIRLIQENDRSLISKIQSTLVNTVPLWKQQLAQALTVHRSREAAAKLAAATDLTNDLLNANADGLQQANREVRTQTERSVFDIHAVAQANQKLIDTINESIELAEKGREARQQAGVRLQQIEQELSDSLRAASLRMQSLEGRANTHPTSGAKHYV